MESKFEKSSLSAFTKENFTLLRAVVWTLQVMEILKVSVAKIGLSSDPSEADYVEVGRNLYDAFSKLGFVYLCDHGIDSNVISEAFWTSKEFFCLSPEVKNLVRKFDGSGQGYVGRGQEIFDASQDAEKASDEIREAYDLTSLDPKGVFPDVPNFQSSMTSLARLTRELAFRVLRSLALGLGLQEDFFLNIHKNVFEEGNTCQFRTIYYPPISADDQKLPGAVRCGTHSDYGTLTFLFQDNAGGLEVQAVDKTWIQATPIEGCILVNVGDLLEKLTNGLFPATRHRVKIPDDEAKLRKARQSIPFFLEPDRDTLISPIPGLNGEPKYEPVVSDKYLLSRLQATYQ